MPTKITVREYCERWLETAAKPRVRSKTLVDYEGLLSRHVFPLIGGRPLSKLQPLDVQSFYSAMHAQGLSARTIRSAPPSLIRTSHGVHTSLRGAKLPSSGTRWNAQNTEARLC